MQYAGYVMMVASIAALITRNMLFIPLAVGAAVLILLGTQGKEDK